ncbi:glycogen synthase [Paenibacillus oenotherae]|uniref:Glycogen synthase n=1 Tax=Paenibacillus oenotherae TaxID=1435645 RepID=A0ABS7DBQ8_9BACL|nr:glycogen/starch synthase [Paenibacillus oenotherae]MBW7477346.1 glycogen synthase [Paenibacillus oenotherae]
MNNTVLFVTSQLYPFTTGTMGIFNYSLPKNLIGMGWDARVIVPKVNKTYRPYPHDTEVIAELNIAMGDKAYACTIEACVYDGVPLYFIQDSYYFGRDELYGYEDEVERFSFFTKAVLEALPHLGFKPKLLHCQDWHTGFIPLLKKVKYAGQPFYEEIKTLYTIHNMGYQGIFDQDNCLFLDMDWEELLRHRVDYYEQLNFMKTGLLHADKITAVSPTYAKEIATEQYGSTLELTVQERQADICGVLCGLDLEINNPSADARIYANYDEHSLDGKYANKRMLQQALGFQVREDIPILSLFSRLKTEKGLDLVKNTFKDIMKLDIQFVMVSNGDAVYEEFFQEAARKYPDKFSFTLYDNDFAYKAYAGSDLFLMPSSYEPCGIGQLIALRYGTVPIVRQVGGLNDSIQHYNEETGEGNGFLFKHYNAKVMLYTIRQAIEVYKRKETWENIVRNCMVQNHGWPRYVKEYTGVYERVLGA